MIIAFGGRLGSGKTILSSGLLKDGFIKIAFADYLKNLIAKTYNFDVSMLQNPIGKSEELTTPLIWNKEIAKKLFNFAEISNFNYDIENCQFNTRRDAAQYIGTNILRAYDNEFHIKKTFASLKHGSDYVCDDVRFDDELHALKQMGAKCYYILRPSNFQISNHSSETSLNWSDFDYHIINDKTIKDIQEEFQQSLKYINVLAESCSGHPFTREDLIESLIKNNYDINKTSIDLHATVQKIHLFAKKLLVHLPFNDKSAFLFANKLSCYYAGVLASSGQIVKGGMSGNQYSLELKSTSINLINGLKDFVKSNNNVCSMRKNNKTYYIFNIKCPFIIENLKRWDYIYNHNLANIPNIIANNIEMIGYWASGKNDGLNHM